MGSSPVAVMGSISWTVQVEITKFRDRRYIYNIPADPTTVRVKGPENVYDFSPFRLVERKVVVDYLLQWRDRLEAAAQWHAVVWRLRAWNFMKLNKRLAIFGSCDFSEKENAAMASKSYKIWLCDRPFFVGMNCEFLYFRNFISFVNFMWTWEVAHCFF